MPPGSVPVLSNILSILCNAACLKTASDMIITNSDAMPALLTWALSNNNIVQTKAMNTLSNLAMDPGHREMLGKAGLVEILLKLIERQCCRHKETINKEVVENACSVLNNLLYQSATNKERFLRCEGIELLLVEILSNDNEHRSVCMAALRVLRVYLGCCNLSYYCQAYTPRSGEDEFNKSSQITRETCPSGGSSKVLRRVSSGNDMESMTKNESQQQSGCVDSGLSTCHSEAVSMESCKDSTKPHQYNSDVVSIESESHDSQANCTDLKQNDLRVVGAESCWRDSDSDITESEQCDLPVVSNVLCSKMPQNVNANSKSAESSNYVSHFYDGKSGARTEYLVLGRGQRLSQNHNTVADFNDKGATRLMRSSNKDRIITKCSSKSIQPGNAEYDSTRYPYEAVHSSNHGLGHSAHKQFSANLRPQGHGSSTVFPAKLILRPPKTTSAVSQSSRQRLTSRNKQVLVSSQNNLFGPELNINPPIPTLVNSSSDVTPNTYGKINCVRNLDIQRRLCPVNQTSQSGQLESTLDTRGQALPVQANEHSTKLTSAYHDKLLLNPNNGTSCQMKRHTCSRQPASANQSSNTLSLQQQQTKCYLDISNDKPGSGQVIKNTSKESALDTKAELLREPVSLVNTVDFLQAVYAVCRKYIKGESIPFQTDLTHHIMCIQSIDDFKVTACSKVVCSFLNTGVDGTVYYGIGRNNTVEGLPFDRDTRDSLSIGLTQMMNSLKPLVTPKLWHMEFVPVFDQHRQLIKDVFVLEIHIHKAGCRLYCNKDNEVYLRKGGQIDKASYNDVNIKAVRDEEELHLPTVRRLHEEIAQLRDLLSKK